MNAPKLMFKDDNDNEYPEWEKTKLGEYLSFKNGLNFSGDKIGHGVKLIGVLDILNDNYITYSSIRGEVIIDDKTLKDFSVEYGDLLFQRCSEIREDAGKSNVYLDKNHIATFGGFVIRGKKKKEYDPQFMNYILNSYSVRRQIMHLAQGEQHVNVGQEMLAKIKLSMPIAEEQQKIADFFSTLDQIISDCQSEIDAWEQQKKGMMQQLFNQKIRFKKDDGSEYPEWETAEIGKYLAIRDEKQIPTEDVPLMAFIANVGVADKGDRYDRSYLVKDDNKKYKRTELNDFIYSSNNLDVGSIGLNTYGTAVISVVYEIFKPKDNVIPIIINDVIQQPKTMSAILQYRQGCLYGQYKIYPEDFLSVKISMPSCLEEQQKIADCLSAFDAIIDKSKQELEAYQKMKKGLMQQMFV